MKIVTEKLTIEFRWPVKVTRGEERLVPSGHNEQARAYLSGIPGVIEPLDEFGKFSKYRT